MITKVVNPQRIAAKCDVCKETITVPNKGLGRAKLAAWVTQHQHTEEGG